MKQTSEAKPERFRFCCTCGIESEIDLSAGPAKFEAECPDLECRRVYQIEYVGRLVPIPAEPSAPLRLVR